MLDAGLSGAILCWPRLAVAFPRPSELSNNTKIPAVCCLQRGCAANRAVDAQLEAVDADRSASSCDPAGKEAPASSP